MLAIIIVITGSATFIISALMMGRPSSVRAMANTSEETITIQWAVSFYTHLAPNGIKVAIGCIESMYGGRCAQVLQEPWEVPCLAAEGSQGWLPGGDALNVCPAMRSRLSLVSAGEAGCRP